MNTEIAVVIPCFNEVQSIDTVINRIRKAVPDLEIFIVDDGSTDGTAMKAAELGIVVFSHPYNKGNGAAVKTAIRSLTHKKLIIIDADEQHPPEMIPQLLTYADKYDLAVGARMSGKAERYRKFGNYFFSWLAGYLAGFDIPDLTSGFRLIDREKAEEFLHLYPNGFSFPTTSTLAFISAGYSVAFMPITVSLRTQGTVSKIRPLHDGMRFLYMIFRIASMINCMKIFLPSSFFLMLAGTAWTVRTLLHTSAVSAAGAFLIGSGVNILFFGIVVDQLSALRMKPKK